MTIDQHLEPDTVALILDGRLGRAERAEVTRHLADCPICRAEVAEVDRALQRVPVRRWQAAGWLAAAAVVLAVAIPRLVPGFRPDSPDLERGAPSGGIAALPVYAPLGDPNRPDGLVWGSAGPGTSYQITVVDRVGSLLWQSETEDTVVRFPAGFRLPAQGPVFWSVDALQRDGSLRSTGPIALIGAR